MGLSYFDRELLDKCLEMQPGSWERLTDRFAGLMMAVVTHVANSRDIRTTIMDREDVVAKIFKSPYNCHCVLWPLCLDKYLPTLCHVPKTRWW